MKREAFAYILQKRDSHANSSNKQINMYKMVWWRCPGFSSIDTHLLLVFISYRKRNEQSEKQAKKETMEIRKSGETEEENSGGTD